MERGQGSDKKDGKENNDCQSLMDKDRERDEQIFLKTEEIRKRQKGKDGERQRKKKKSEACATYAPLEITCHGTAECGREFHTVMFYKNTFTKAACSLPPILL